MEMSMHESTRTSNRAGLKDWYVLINLALRRAHQWPWAENFDAHFLVLVDTRVQEECDNW